LRVALVHDWITGMRGGERVLDELAGLYPDADLYTLFHVRGTTTSRIDRLRIQSSALSRLPGAHRYYRALLPLFPRAIERFRPTGYDLVISISHAVAKGIRVEPSTAHLCYCLTPMRYVWDHADVYLGRGFRRVMATPLIRYLQRFDVRTSVPERVTRFTAVSQTVADRIRRCYDRDAHVVYPPVDLERIRPNGLAPEDFFLLVGAFVPYKLESIAIEAFRRTGLRLIAVGEGPGRARLIRRAPPNVEFIGRVSDAVLADLYARCRALVFPSEEDFGLVPVEAQAAGRPVIAFGRGGACESVVELKSDSAQHPPGTGIFFAHQTADALAEALGRFATLERGFDSRAIRANAERFGAAYFRDGMLQETARAIEDRLARNRGEPRAG
jgi:glycosyltransferase involved in cell wall biosynthesis